MSKKPRNKPKPKRAKKPPFKFKAKCCKKLCSVSFVKVCYANHNEAHCDHYFREKRGC